MSWIRTGAFRSSLKSIFAEEEGKYFTLTLFYILPFFPEREHLVFANF